jgi:hypothetical protein
VERKNYNRKLIKLMKNQKHVTIMNVDFERQCFMSHGLRMNGTGKTKTAQQIAERCKKNLAEEKILPIPMTWTLHLNVISNSMQNIEPVINYNGNLYGSDQIHQDKQEENIDGEKKKMPVEMDFQEKRSSGRIRKQSRMMRNDFLWSTH